MSAFCSEPGCVGIAQPGKWCAAHVADNYQRRRAAARPERDSWYARAAWYRRVRPHKLQHDPMCEKPGCGRPATDVHHKDDSWKTTGDWRLFIDQANLESLCHQHHSEETMRRNQERGLICTAGQ
jgi:hypothetical protein